MVAELAATGSFKTRSTQSPASMIALAAALAAVVSIAQGTPQPETTRRSSWPREYGMCATISQSSQPAPNDLLRMWPVSKRVNVSGRGDDDLSLIERVEEDAVVRKAKSEQSEEACQGQPEEI